MSNDYFMRQIEDITRCVASILFHRKVYRHETMVQEERYLESSFLFYRLKQLLLDGQVNEAENLLFDCLKANPCYENLQVALDFYEDLAKFSEEELTACNFSRQEIWEGLVEIRKIFGLST